VYGRPMEGTTRSTVRTTASKEATATSALQIVHLLAYLRDLARHGGGYELRGARGWATAADAGDATGAVGAGESLKAAFQRGDLIREDVSVPDAASPVWVYRITDGTARRMAELEGVEHVPVQASGAPVEQRAYVRPGVLTALDALRYAAENSSARRARIAGEPEWRTARELTGWLRTEGDRTGHERSFLSDDLAWAVKTGLMERRELPPPPSSPRSVRPVIAYRITVAGAAVKPLVWHDPEHEEDRGAP
jgi:hypothetical protein